MLTVSEEVIVFDNLSGKLNIIVHADPNQNNAYLDAQNRLDEIIEILRNNKINELAPDDLRDVDENDFISGFTQNNFEDAVCKIKDYIVNGDAMQVVLSQRLSIPFQSKPINLYLSLIHI